MDSSSKKSIYIAIVALGLIVMSIAYASLSTSLKINGQANIPGSNWNIHFANWQLNTAGTINGHTNTAVYPSVSELTQTISVANSTKVEDLNVTLYQPGDYARYTFEIVNDGSTDALLESFENNLTCTSGNNCINMVYAVECYDKLTEGNNVLSAQSLLPKDGGKAYCFLEVRYNDQTINNIPGGDQIYTQEATSASIDASWKYIQKVKN